MRSPGFVYVMVNPRAPQLVRVGKTDRPPEDAAREANLQLRDAGYFSDCMGAEGFCHDYLETFNTGNDPEMFEVPVEIALKALSLAMEKHVGTRANIPVNSSLYDEEPQVSEGTTATTLYEEGLRHRREQNPVEAIRYFKRAARLSEPRAFSVLAEMYESGQGCPADVNRAMEWLHEGTRSGARECWGALADRLPQTKYLRPYFTGLDVPGLNVEQRNNTVRRMRLYLQLAANGLTQEDLNAIEGVMEQLGERDLQRQWKQLRAGAKRSGGGVGSILKWGIALTIAAAVGILVPLMFFRGNTETPAPAAASDAAAAATAEAEAQSSLTGSAPGRSKTTSPSSTAAKLKAPGSKVPQTPAEAAAVARPVIHDPSSTPEPAPVARVEAPVIRTAPVAEAASAREISAQELQEHFSYDKGKATAAFKDSLIKITEPVEKVGKHDLSFKKIKCKFDGAPPDRISAGMTVTVEGVVHGKGQWTGTITLEHCRVL